MLGGILPSLGEGPYSITVEGSGLRVRWNLNKYVNQGRLTYIHGRDYGELFRSHNLIMKGQTSNPSGPVQSPDQLSFVALSKGYNTQSERSRFYIDLTRPPRFVNPNEKIERLLVDPIAGKRAVSHGADHLISTITTVAPEVVRHNKGEFTAFVDRVRGTMVAEDTLINLEGLEGTVAAAVIIACANQETNRNKLILGPSRYRLLVQGKQVPRPMVKESRVISVYAKATGASETDVGRHFDEWSFLPVNPTVIKSGRTRGRYLTQADITNFVSWQPDVDESAEIPSPVEGEIQFAVEGGQLVKVRDAPHPPSSDRVASIRAGVKHLLNLLDDISVSAHLGNWSPGAVQKLDRLERGLREIENSSDISDRDVTLIALDGEAFRHVYKASEDELSDAAKAEFAPLLLQMDIVFSQFQSWKNFKQFGSSISWGAGFTDEYRQALRGVAEGIGDFPEPAATSEVRSAMQEAAEKIASKDVTEQVAATARVQNLLSGLFRYFKGLSGKAVARVGGEVEKVVLSGTDSVLHQATVVIRGRLIELASSNPSIFGWVLHFFRQ